MTSKLPVELIKGSGTSGQVLTSNGTGSSPSMQDITVNDTFTKVLMLDVGDETTDLTTGTAKKTFRMPFNLDVSELRASVNTAPVGSDIIVDINADGTTLMSTNKITIDAGEKTSTTAATSPGITTSQVSDDAEMTIDIDQVGSTTAGKGLKVVMKGTLWDPSDPISGLISSACCDIDATVSSSYSGSGETISNIVTSPFDGASQTDYDFWLGGDGTTANNPVFTGTAGDSGAYFNWGDNADFIQIKANTSLINKMHEEAAGGGDDWWYALAGRFDSGANAFAVSICTGGNTASDEGWEHLMFGSGAANWNITRNGTRTPNASIHSGVSDGLDFLAVVTYDASTDDLKIAFNTKTPVTDTDICTGTGAAPNPARNLTIGRRNDDSLTSSWQTNARFYHFSMGNEYLSDAQIGQIFDYINARHNRTYA